MNINIIIEYNSYREATYGVSKDRGFEYIIPGTVHHCTYTNKK